MRRPGGFSSRGRARHPQDQVSGRTAVAGILLNQSSIAIRKTLAVCRRPDSDRDQTKQKGPLAGPPNTSTKLGRVGALGSEARRADCGEDADNQQQDRSDPVKVRERHFRLSSCPRRPGGGVGAASMANV